MWKLLLRNKYWPIGIDIGTDGIRMLQMHRVGGTLRVCACGRWRFPDSLDSDDARRRELAIQAVREMLRTEPFRRRRVVSSLSCERLHIKSIRLPQLPDDEIADAVRWEARERFGFDIPSSQLSYFNAGEVRQGTETRSEIVVIAASSEQVDQHMELLGEMGLTVEHLDAHPIALFRVFERFLRREEDSRAVTVVVDLGRIGTRIVVGRGREIIFVKSIGIGGRDLTEGVAKQLKLDFHEASELRMQAAREFMEAIGRDGSAGAIRDPNSLGWTVRDALRAQVEELVREILLCLRYCAVTFRGVRPEKMLLVGGGALDPVLVDLLDEQLKVKCVTGAPLKGIDVSAVDLGSDRRGTLAEWAPCAGLAMRNVEPKEILGEIGNAEPRLSA